MIVIYDLCKILPWVKTDFCGKIPITTDGSLAVNTRT
jgi:hypothetical protein